MIKVLPIYSNPWEEDSDGDGISNEYDTYKLSTLIDSGYDVTVLRDGYGAWKMFSTPDDAAKDFVIINNPLTHEDGNERAAFIYKLRINILPLCEFSIFMYPYTIIGGQDNVVVGFLTGYSLLPRIYTGLSNISPIAFVHTHPYCHCHIGEGFSSPDISLSYLPGIQYVYLGTPKGFLYRINSYGTNLTEVVNGLPIATKYFK